jgi:hypothetical protein
MSRPVTVMALLASLQLCQIQGWHCKLQGQICKLQGQLSPTTRMTVSYTDGSAPATRIALPNKGEVYHIHGQLFQWHDRYRPGFANYIDSSALLAIWKTLTAGMSTALKTARMTQSTTGTICQHALNLLSCVWNIWSTTRTVCQLQDRLNLHRCM